ncbi:DegT/DnrJ/EryC1/StrS family aminotransferase [Colwellia hornerae]|uniref:DegT/DnrJ/EryC1/StrS aminotransferase family protein n=1 Tax=Colwellia hornerae TaxID=89402 RepID=A0A5C6QJS6_9GAMM|nr:DegT/DnrJ/EryC1/StrS aminotransferase family protein [Colwellia hornerae]TWX54044.1 DegT/DnrJ/EryC1/StrS aminotransferase family protein [Colwellia hornerae]TWX60819.1 DegT/DnrJ/EryC1/StrS aminotransferase family protein [Colwellia hornerae]TWX69149.1 DegT/DnrJ/EryC1/StrS aminotransferase family protein [Colwellia hornerae]
MLSSPLSPWPSFTQEEADKVSSILLSNKVNYWTGQEGREFEREFATYTDSKYAIALSNGTLALDLALVALGIGARNGGLETDEVIVTSRTFLASASVIVTAGARPIFADVDANTQNITKETVDDVLTSNTKAIIAVHLAGLPCEMEELMALADSSGLYVIEDCAQAHGAKYHGRSVGSIGHIGCWSFCQDKIMTTGGEGGMVTTDDESLWRKMWSYKDHGKSYEAVYEREHAPGFRWLHESFGTNWRMTEMQSAIGRIQLGRMPEWFRLRGKYAAIIADTCSLFDCIRVPIVPEHMEHANYKYYVFVKPEFLAYGWDRDRIIAEINALDVPCMQGSCSEVYLEKAFDNTGFRPEKRLLVARELGNTSLMFLVHPTLAIDEIERMTNAISIVLDKAQK